MFFTWLEVVYLIVLIVVVGYIFSDIFVKKRLTPDDIIKNKGSVNRFFNWQNFKYAVLIAAPGILLHELAHKFVAMGFGLEATFFIWGPGIAFGVVLKLIGSSFLVLAPGYVMIAGATPFQSAITSLAGPLMNAVIWISCMLFLKFKQKVSKKVSRGVFFMGKLNMWLFIFNMIPIPPLDGSKVLFYIIGLFG